MGADEAVGSFRTTSERQAALDEWAARAEAFRKDFSGPLLIGERVLEAVREGRLPKFTTAEPEPDVRSSIAERS